MWCPKLWPPHNKDKSRVYAENDHEHYDNEAHAINPLLREGSCPLHGPTSQLGCTEHAPPNTRRGPGTTFQMAELCNLQLVWKKKTSLSWLTLSKPVH